MVLARTQWEENEQYRHYQGFNPHKRVYLQYEDLGLYFHFCGRDAGKLIASAGIYLTPSMHTQHLIAQEDTFYITPAYRGRGRLVFRFVEFTEEFAREKGAQQFLLTTPLVNTRSERVVQHLGYYQISKGWAKDLQRSSQEKVA